MITIILTILGLWLAGAAFVFIVSKIICPQAMPGNLVAILVVLVVWPSFFCDAVSDLAHTIRQLFKK